MLFKILISLKAAFAAPVFDPVTVEDFETKAVDINVTFVDKHCHECVSLQQHPVQENILLTVFNGKCKEFIIEGTFKPKMYLEFLAPNDTKLIIFFLHPGEEFLLLYHFWIEKLVPLAYVDSSMMVEISRNVVKSF